MTFSAPLHIGNAFGPGRQVVTCLTCGAVVLAEVPAQETHDGWHAALPVAAQS